MLGNTTSVKKYIDKRGIFFYHLSCCLEVILMKLTINQIRKGSVNEPYFFDGQADVTELEMMNNDIRKISPVHVTGQIPCMVKSSM